MAGKFTQRGEFTIPSEVFDEHEWMADALIDSIVGVNCTLIYPPNIDECPNCVLDTTTGRSASIYKAGGPVPFTNYTECPWCYGEGHLSTNTTDTIKLRVYTDPRNWVETSLLNPSAVQHPDGYALVIGYMSDLVKMNRCIEVILYADVQDIGRIRCKPDGAAIPHGFRRNRYFAQLVKRL